MGNKYVLFHDPEQIGQTSGRYYGYHSPSWDIPYRQYPEKLSFLGTDTAHPAGYAKTSSASYAQIVPSDENPAKHRGKRLAHWHDGWRHHLPQHLRRPKRNDRSGQAPYRLYYQPSRSRYWFRFG